LDKDGLSTNTLVVFMSDNGGATLSRNAPLSKGKASLWEGGIRVPCVARYPREIPAGYETHQVGITMDWTATIAKLAGAKAPATRPFEGMDLMRSISGKQRDIERTLFWRSVNFSFVKLYRAVRTGDWKYIESYDGKETFLYNLANDIGEKNNVLAATHKLALKKKLDEWERKVDPPYYVVEPTVKLK
jgi:arylsulfatase A